MPILLETVENPVLFCSLAKNMKGDNNISKHISVECINKWFQTKFSSKYKNCNKTKDD